MAGRVTHSQPLEISNLVRERLRRLLLHLDDLRSFVPPPGAWHPAVDLCEMDNAIVIRVDIPGLRNEDVRVTIRDNTLKIEGRKQKYDAVGGPGVQGVQGVQAVQSGVGRYGNALRYLCLERTYGSFSRSFSLECPVQVEDVTARMASGILEIRLPKTSSSGRDVLIPITE